MDSASGSNDQTLRNWLEEIIKTREISPAYILSILTEYGVARKELLSMLSRCTAKKSVATNLSDSYAESTHLIADMEQQIAKDRPAVEEEEKMLHQLQVVFDKLQAKCNQVIADPMSNSLILTELGFEAKLQARNKLNNPDLASLRSDLKDKQEKKQSLEKELAILNRNIRSLKSSLDYYRV